MSPFWADFSTAIDPAPSKPLQLNPPQAAACDQPGGDGGYMAIFQVDDFAAARERVTRLGVRIAWEIELEDISAMHLHPADVPGAIVSLDEPRPPASWRWAGDWSPTPGAIGGITVEAPAGTRERWTEVLGEEPPGVRFTEGGRGIVEVVVEHDGPEATDTVCGVAVSVVNPSPDTEPR